MNVDKSPRPNELIIESPRIVEIKSPKPNENLSPHQPVIKL